MLRRSKSKAPKRHFIYDAVGAVSAAIFVRTALPYVLTRLANIGIGKSGKIRGRVGDVSLNFIGGSFSVSNVQLESTDNSIPVTYAHLENAQVRIQWRDLFKGRVITSIDIDKPQVWLRANSGDATPSHKEVSVGHQKQNENKKGNANWNRQVQKLLPIKIDHIAIHDGEVHVRNVPGQNGSDLRLEKINFRVDNITNSERVSHSLKATVIGSAYAMNSGRIDLSAEVYPLADQPTFNADFETHGLQLAELNDFFRHFTANDVKRGQLDVVAEAAAANGVMEGYAKPVVSDLVMEKLHNQPAGDATKSALVRGMTHLLKNKHKETIATRVHFEGRIDDPKVGTGAAIKNVFKNAFMDGYDASLHESIDYPSAQKAAALRTPARKSGLQKFFDLIKETFSRWTGDNAPRMGAALSYYTAFSIAPLLLLSIAIAGLIFGKDAAQGRIIGELGGMMGKSSAQAIQSMLQAASKPSSGIAATVIGFLTLLLGASGVMSELKEELDNIWRVKPKTGFKALIKDRLASLGMVLVIGFLLLVSLVVSAGVSALGAMLKDFLPMPEFVMQLVNFLVSFGVILLLFAAMYKVLPDAKIKWHDVWIGAAITSFLFSVGKLLIGLYLGKATVSSSYGAAGSVLVMLLWIYYSAQILYFGAEFTKIYADRYGSGVKPSHADIPEKIAY